MNELDLHGISHDEAIKLVEDFVFSESNKGYAFSCKIITGNSQRLQDRIIKEVLDVYNFRYYIPSWNTGQIIVS